MSDPEKEHTMRVFAAGAGGAVGARLVPQLIDQGHKVTGTYRSPGNAGRAGAPGAELIALGQQPARVWRRVVGGS
jgi:nucleoside-diphosphate-sugar epimerase